MAESPRKDAAIRFLKLVVVGKTEEAFRDLAAPDFRHHNPYFPGDAASLAKAMKDASAQHPGSALEIKHAIEDGELVAIHSHVRHGPSDRGFATVHLFRFSGDRVAELWDIAMALPESSANEHGVF